MADGIELGKAYVQIVPSAQGIKSALTEMFDEETDGLGEQTGQSIGQELIGTLKKVIAAAGIGKIISDSINMGGALQQSLGGVETLFGAGGRTIEEYAQSVGKSVETTPPRPTRRWACRPTTTWSRPPALPPACCPA